MIVRTLLILLSAVVAAVVLAFTFELPQPKPIDPATAVKVNVVPARERVHEPGTIMEVGELEDGYVYQPGHRYAAPMPVQAPPEPVYTAPVRVVEPEARRAPAPSQSDPVYYRRYVQESVRQAPPPMPRVYQPQERPRVQQVDPDRYSDRPRTYYYDPNPRRDAPPPPPRRTEELNRQRGCNAMATWCENSRARNENRGRMQENRGEDFFE